MLIYYVFGCKKARVIKTKSVEFMPFTLSFFLTISAIMWFAYGLFLHDICIAVSIYFLMFFFGKKGYWYVLNGLLQIPNVVGFILGLVQMVLYGVYRNSGEKLDIEKNVNNSSEQQLKTIVVMNPSGVSEVHPVDVTVMEPVIPLSYTVVHHEDPSKFSKEEEPLTEAGQGHVETAGSRIWSVLKIFHQSNTYLSLTPSLSLSLLLLLARRPAKERRCIGGCFYFCFVSYLLLLMYLHKVFKGEYVF